MTGREQAERVITLFIPPELGDGWTEDAIVWWETDPTSKAKAVLWSGRRREAQECLETWHEMLAAALDAHAAEAVRLALPVPFTSSSSTVRDTPK